MRLWGALLLCLAVALASGCGGGDEGGDSTAALAPIRGPKPPPDASPLLRRLYRNFQPPLPDPSVPGSGRAIRAGIRACDGLTPAQAKRRFIARSDLSADQRGALQNLERAEEAPGADFPAGQLAAMVYEGTLAGELAPYAYRGCVYALAEELKGQLR